MMKKDLIHEKGLIFNFLKHSFDENCPISAVNASHFLPCEPLFSLCSGGFAK